MKEYSTDNLSPELAGAVAEPTVQANQIGHPNSDRGVVIPIRTGSTGLLANPDPTSAPNYHKAYFKRLPDKPRYVFDYLEYADEPPPRPQ